MKRLLSLIFICSLLLSNPIFAQGQTFVKTVAGLTKKTTETVKTKANRRFQKGPKQLGKHFTGRHWKVGSYSSTTLLGNNFNWKEYEKNTEKAKKPLENAKILKKDMTKPSAHPSSYPWEDNENSLKNAPKLHNENYDHQMSGRGLVKEKHIMSQSDNSKSITENKNGILSPPTSNDMNEVRMKIMRFQNRLNKYEMKKDTLIFMGLIINQNEYDEYYIANYAA